MMLALPSDAIKLGQSTRNAAILWSMRRFSHMMSGNNSSHPCTFDENDVTLVCAKKMAKKQQTHLMTTPFHLMS
jgi:hypothetical protein